MQVTVIGIYDNIDEARATEGELETEGFSARDISISAEEESGSKEPEPTKNRKLVTVPADDSGGRHRHQKIRAEVSGL